MKDLETLYKIATESTRTHHRIDRETLLELVVEAQTLEKVREWSNKAHMGSSRGQKDKSVIYFCKECSRTSNTIDGGSHQEYCETGKLRAMLKAPKKC